MTTMATGDGAIARAGSRRMRTKFSKHTSGLALVAVLPASSDDAGGTNAAAPPPVCEVFTEFCECATCLALDRQGACDPCPDL